jgi:hypothetical protein
MEVGQGPIEAAAPKKKKKRETMLRYKIRVRVLCYDRWSAGQSVLE